MVWVSKMEETWSLLLFNPPLQGTKINSRISNCVNFIDVKVLNGMSYHSKKQQTECTYRTVNFAAKSLGLFKKANN